MACAGHGGQKGKAEGRRKGETEGEARECVDQIPGRWLPSAHTEAAAGSPTTGA